MRQHKAQHGEIPVSGHRSPSIITRGDMRQSISILRHRDASIHYGPALDAVLRLIALAPADLIRQARVVEGEAQDA